jgi:hypothetical protein
MDRKQGNPKVAESLRNRLYALGYRDMTEFCRASGIPLSHETVRRALNGERLWPENMVKIATYLDFTPEEIRRLLEQLGDKFWIRYIGNSALSQQEEVLLLAIKKILSKSGEAKGLLRTQLELVAKVAGVSIDTEMEFLQRCSCPHLRIEEVNHIQDH